MPSARSGQSSIQIAAAPDLVYDLVSDVTRMGDWSPECYRCEWLKGATVAAPGARFRGYNRLGPTRWQRTAVVDVAERGHAFGFTTLDERAGRDETRWRYTIEPSSSGTLLTESFELLWCSTLTKLIELPLPRGRQVRRGIEQTLQRIKRVAESSA